MPIRIEPFDGPIGASVSGVDISQALDDADQKMLADAWNEHSVLVFRDQALTPEQLLRYSRYFGDLEIHVLDQYLHPEYPEILIVSNIVDNGRHIGIPDAGRKWHSDLSYIAEPSRGSVLFAIEIPERDGKAIGDTKWASTAAAYEALPETKRRQLAGLKANFSLTNRFGTQEKKEGDRDVAMSPEQIEKIPMVTHPVVRTHPVTGRKCLFINEGHTIEIDGMAADESRALLEELFAHCTKPEFVYTHSWRPGDVVMWDNIPTQHLAIHDYEPHERRLLQRTTLAGDRPF